TIVGNSRIACKSKAHPHGDRGVWVYHTRQNERESNKIQELLVFAEHNIKQAEALPEFVRLGRNNNLFTLFFLSHVLKWVSLFKTSQRYDNLGGSLCCSMLRNY